MEETKLIGYAKTVGELIMLLQQIDPNLVVGSSDCCYRFSDEVQVLVGDELFYDRDNICVEHGVHHRHVNVCVITS